MLISKTINEAFKNYLEVEIPEICINFEGSVRVFSRYNLTKYRSTRMRETTESNDDGL